MIPTIRKTIITVNTHINVISSVVKKVLKKRRKRGNQKHLNAENDNAVRIFNHSANITQLALVQ
jgi:hypothetical protein